MANFDLRRAFLYLLIASVAVSAVFAIAVILFGDFGDFEVRVMMTTLTLTAASILGLACGAALEAGKARVHPYAGIVFSILSALALFLIIWNVFDESKIYIKSTLTAVMVAVVCSHLSLLSLARLDARFRWSRPTAMALDWVLAAILLYLMWFEPEGDSDIVFRVIAVLSILIGAVTVMTPVFHKLSGPDDPRAEIDAEILRLRERIDELERKKAGLIESS
jgi:hypothetical protein